MLLGITSLLGRLAAVSHAGAVANARAAATEAGRRRVEHAEVAHYLAGLAGTADDRSAEEAAAEHLA